MDFMNFILENNFILVAVLWVIGQVIKKNTKINNGMIIFMLFAISVILMLLRTPLITTENIYDVLTQSVLVSGGAMFVNETPKQIKKLFEKNK